MAKDLKISYLLDFYGEMLTPPQREMIEAYYNEDLSLGEIAEEREISRQGVRDAVKRAELQLHEMEEKLGLVKRFHEVHEGLANICDSALAIQEANAGANESIDALVTRILEEAKRVAENG